MKSYEFMLIANGVDGSRARFADRFFEAGCDDATISLQKGVAVFEFAREAKSFLHAVASAVADVESAGATVVHVEPDYLVSLSEIATRVGVTRAAVSLYANGDRGKSFPVPVHRITTESPLWDWVEVARWFERQGRLTPEDLLQAKAVKRANREIAKRARRAA